MSGCKLRAREAREGQVTAPRERQTDSRAEKGLCCSSVTEAFGACCVCCPTFGMSVHMKNAQVAALATAAVEG